MTPRSATAAAFLAIILVGGGNGVAVRFSDHELPPFWGATLRFGIAAFVLLALVIFRRVPLPRGSALTGAILYGVFGFGAAFALIYWGLERAPAGLGQVILALVPLLTFLFAVSQGLERFRSQSLAGALLALGGILVVFSDRLTAAVPLASMLAIVLAAACMAESNVIVKKFPRSHPLATNAIAMSAGTAMLLGLSLVAGESRALPVQAQTWAAVAYVSLAGSVGVFSLFLYVIARWSASSSSYVMLLMPLVTVALAAGLAGETVSPAFLVGGLLVLAGVYVGAFAPSLSRLVSPRVAPATALAVDGPATAPVVPTSTHPGCA
jgi:drug/metabolite transporter (DMT)-like permease